MARPASLHFNELLSFVCIQVRVWDIRRSGCLRILDQYCTSAPAARQQQHTGMGGPIAEACPRGIATAGLGHHSAAASALLASAMGCGDAPSSSSTVSESRGVDISSRRKRGRGEDAPQAAAPEEEDAQPAVPQGGWSPSGGWPLSSGLL